MDKEDREGGEAADRKKLKENQTASSKLIKKCKSTSTLFFLFLNILSTNEKGKVITMTGI